MTDRTDTDALLAYVNEHHQDVPRAYVDPTDPGDIQHLVIPETSELVIIDPECHANRPRRSRGLVDVYDAPSFVAAVRHRTDDVDGPVPVVYADEANNGLVAVLNDDQGPEAGWRDHRVVLRLRRTPEWTAWTAGQGLGTQERFAARIEDGTPEIRDPAAAQMLDLAQTFHATTAAKFRSGIRLADGSRQFVYDEDIKATAGAGQFEVPETFTLAVRPFIGSDVYEVKARFRFTLRAGDLKVGYTLFRPEEVERDAFRKVTGAVTEALDGVLVLSAPAPSVTSSG